MTKPFSPIHNDLFTSGMAATLSSSAFVVLTAILMHADRSTHQCWPSEETLARLAGVSRRSVIRHIKELESIGIITVAKRRTTTGVHNVYTINSVRDAIRSGRFNPPDWAEACDTTVTPTPGHVTPATEARDTTVTRHVTPLSQEQEPINKNQETTQARPPASAPSSKPGPPDYTAEFEAWWKTYPPRKGRRKGKAEAFREWSKLDPSEYDDLAVATAHLAGHDGYPPDAQRFLRSDWRSDWLPEAEPDASTSDDRGNPEGQAYLEMSVDELNRVWVP